MIQKNSLHEETHHERDVLWLLQEKYGGIKGDSFEKDVERLRSGELLAYVIGFTPFLRTKIYLDSHPLIPRPETEWWTEQFLLSLEKDVPYHILDLCAGSGAIGVALLKHHPLITVTFADIREDHLKTIEKNVRENGILETRVHIIQSDLFHNISLTFDRIVTNPPYIPDARKLPSSVKDNEPHDALFSGEDGFLHIKKILEGTKKHLNKDGELWCEIDITHEHTALPCAYAGGAETAEIRKDQYGLPRLLVAHY